jgi:hypothetical protein
VCHISLESLDKVYNFSSEFISIGSLHKTLWASKIMGIPIFENFRTPNLGIPGQNDIWVQALWPGIENTIRGKVVASPKSEP